MKEVLRTNDLVKLSYLQAMLKDSGIESALVDENASQVYGDAVMERRLLVLEEDAPEAIEIIKRAANQF